MTDAETIAELRAELSRLKAERDALRSALRSARKQIIDALDVTAERDALDAYSDALEESHIPCGCEHPACRQCARDRKVDLTALALRQARGGCEEPKP